VKRALTLVVGVVVVAALAALVGQFDRERQYQGLLASGEEALRDGNSYLAVEAFSGALALRPASMVAFYRRGEAYRTQRHYEAAIRDWKDAHRLAPNAPHPLIALGDLYDLRGEPALAAEQYSIAADLMKDEEPSLLYTLALARYRSGSPAAAVDPLRRAVARNDSIGEAHYLLGLVYRDINEVDNAIVALERAIRVAPKLVPAREELADLFRAAGRPGDELLQLQALASLDPQNDRQIAIALAHARRRQYDVALSQLSAASAEVTSDSRIDLAVGRVLLMRAEETADAATLRRARAALERALGGTVRRSEGLAHYGRALYLADDVVEAERILLEAVATSPADRRAFAYLADASESLRHPIVARDALMKLDLLEGNTTAPDERARRARRIGGLSAQGGDHETAARYLSRAFEAGITDLATLVLLGRAQWEVGEEDAARATLSRAEASAPQHPEVLRLARAIR
jgi:tetratricopeptide (TPR) repeat protein